MTPRAPVEFDPFSSTYFDDPYEMYGRLRDEAPVYWNDTYGFYALSRYEDVCAASKDWERFTSTHGVDLSTLSNPAWENLDSIIMMDPPKHDRLRSLVNRVFTPRAVMALEPMIREVILSFMEPLEGGAEFDAVQDLFAPFPVEIIARMLGVPAADRQMIRHLLDVGLHREEGQMHPTDEGMEAMMTMGAYYYELLQEKRRNPGDDMLSGLVQAEVELDGQVTQLDDVEIAGFAALLGGAGAETVTKLLANAVVLFDANPDEYQKVLDDPDDVIPRAIEEVLRILPPSQYQGRYSTVDSSWHGSTIEAGHPVILVTGAANRDEREFDEPDAFRIDRPPSLALGFGYGIHSCLGAALARMESRIAISEFIRRWPRFEIDGTRLTRVHMANVAGYASVPLRPAA